MSQPDIIEHRGKPQIVKFIGGQWHGEWKRMRRPLKATHQVARPPRYIGNNFYDPSSAMEYETYLLRQDGADLYYVHESLVNDFPANKDSVHETDNARLMRLEREKGGPIDLVEAGLIPHSADVKAKHPQTEDDKAKQDFEKKGIAILVDGKRIDPRRVRLLINIENPLSVNLRDLLDKRV